MAKYTPETKEQRTLREIEFLVTNIGWHDGHVLTGLSCQKTEAGWRATVKVLAAGKPLRATYEAPDYAQVLALVAEKAARGSLFWSHDGYPTYWTKCRLGEKKASGQGGGPTDLHQPRLPGKI